MNLTAIKLAIWINRYGDSFAAVPLLLGLAAIIFAIEFYGA